MHQSRYMLHRMFHQKSVQQIRSFEVVSHLNRCTDSSTSSWCFRLLHVWAAQGGPLELRFLEGSLSQQRESL